PVDSGGEAAEKAHAYGPHPPSMTDRPLLVKLGPNRKRCGDLCRAAGAVQPGGGHGPTDVACEDRQRPEDEALNGTGWLGETNDIAVLTRERRQPQGRRPAPVVRVAGVRPAQPGLDPLV